MRSKTGHFSRGNKAAQKRERVADASMGFRVDYARLNLYRKSAEARGQTLSDWAVDGLDAHAVRCTQSPRPHLVNKLKK